jgi:hypothetical protein
VAETIPAPDLFNVPPLHSSIKKDLPFPRVFSGNPVCVLFWIPCLTGRPIEVPLCEATSRPFSHCDPDLSGEVPLSGFRFSDQIFSVAGFFKAEQSRFSLR